eukprot:389576-Hanusia_phi.AAC.1
MPGNLKVSGSLTSQWVAAGPLTPAGSECLAVIGPDAARSPDRTVRPVSESESSAAVRSRRPGPALAVPGPAGRAVSESETETCFPEHCFRSDHESDFKFSPADRAVTSVPRPGRASVTEPLSPI